jgi:hypothetical protein
MSLRNFLDASYSLMVESFTSLAANRIDLLGAVEKVESGWSKEAEAPARNVTSENDSAMAQLQAMLAGVKGAPV